MKNQSLLLKLCDYAERVIARRGNATVAINLMAEEEINRRIRFSRRVLPA